MNMKLKMFKSIVFKMIIRCFFFLEDRWRIPSSELEIEPKRLKKYWWREIT
jgi:hypothetical protein